MWSENFQIYKLDLEKQRNQWSNCQHSFGHGESKGIPEKHLLCFIVYAKSFDCVDHSKSWKNFKELEYQNTLSVSWEICMQVKKQQLELYMEQQTGSK